MGDSWGCEIWDAGTWDIAEKRPKVTLNRSKKLVSSNETAQTSAIFIYPHRPRREETRHLS